MSYLKINISYAEDFIIFHINDDIFNNNISVGDRLKYGNYTVVVSNRLLVAGVNEAPFNRGDIIYECLYRPTTILEFYKSLDYFKVRFELIGGITTNKPEPALAYKIYRLYCRLNNECVDTKISSDSISTILRLFHILGIGYDVDFEDYINDGFIDILALLFDCIQDCDFDMHIFDDFEALKIRYHSSLSI